MRMNHRLPQNCAVGLKVLLVDDEPINLTILESCLQVLGAQIFKALNGQEAIEVFQNEHPDMVRMDVMVPGMDGLEATRKIKQQCGEHWIPVIMVTSLYSDEDIVSGLEAGADDYLVKPVNFQILKSKIANFALIIRQQQKLYDYRESAEAEGKLALQVMERLVHPTDFGEKLKCWTIPTARFNGDITVGGIAPDGRLQSILADGSGHGLAAALSIVPVIEVFYGMNAKGLPIEQVARELNRKLRKIMPTGHYVAALVFSIDSSKREIKAWNGGIPFAAFISKKGEMLHEWRSLNLPSGLLDDAQFEDSAELFQYNEEGFFFACSDGLLEAEDAAGNPVARERLLGWLSADVPDKVGYIAGQVLLHLGAPAHDDMSFILAPCRFQ